MNTALLKNNKRPANGRFYTIDDCILPPNGTRLVLDNTVTYMGREYYNPLLQRYIGQEVMVFCFEPTAIGICMGPELICVAIAAGGSWSLTQAPDGVDCPVVGEIPTHICLNYQKRPFTSVNPQYVQIYKACRNGCPHSKL